VVGFRFFGRRAVAGEVSSWPLIGQGAMSDFESATRCKPDISGRWTINSNHEKAPGPEAKAAAMRRVSGME